MDGSLHTVAIRITDQFIGEFGKYGDNKDIYT